MSELHPLDFQALTKDMTIEGSQIERIYNVKKDLAPKAFQLCLLRLAHDIERERRDLLCRIKGDSIRIMTDAEANEHTWDEYRRGVRKISKQARRRVAIDVMSLSVEERRIAELRDTHITAQAIINRRALAKAEREMLFENQESKSLLGPEEPEDT